MTTPPSQVLAEELTASFWSPSKDVDGARKGNGGFNWWIDDELLLCWNSEGKKDLKMSGVYSDACYQVVQFTLDTKRKPTRLFPGSQELQRGADFTRVDSSQHGLSQKSSVIKAEQCPGQLKCSFLYDCTSLLIFPEVNILQGALRKWAQSWCRTLAVTQRSSGNGCRSRTITKR